MTNGGKHPWKRLLPIGALALIVLIWGCEWRIESMSRQRCFDEVEALPQAPAAVVLGAAPRLADGRVNLFFRPRLEAAARLFMAGKVKALIVSGDNGSKTYDEPSEMKRVLIELGVPALLSVKTLLREKLACVKAVLDVNVLQTQPRFLGEKVVVLLD